MNGNKYDTLDALIMLSGDVLINKDVAYLNSIDTSDIKISPRFSRKTHRMIRRKCRQKEYGQFIIVTKRIAAAVLIVCSILFASTMSIEAVRNEFWNTIVEWFDKYITISYQVEKIAPTIIVTKKEPTYLPEGYEKAVKADAPTSYIIQYQQNEERRLTYQQKPLTQNEIWIDNKNCSISEVKVNNFNAILAAYADGNEIYTLLWNDEEYSYTIFSYDKSITVEILISIAESVK